MEMPPPLAFFLAANRKHILVMVSLDVIVGYARKFGGDPDLPVALADVWVRKPVLPNGMALDVIDTLERTGQNEPTVLSGGRRYTDHCGIS